MKIICAGLPKTGTTSLATALKILGFTVHDNVDHQEHYMNEYIAAFSGKTPDFTTMYSNIDAVTDNPACYFWEEIKNSFPDAKVILMERDAVEPWVKSKLHTQDVWDGTMKQLWARLGFLLTPTGRKYMKLCEMTFYDEKELPSLYAEHNARVKAAISRDELLVYNVKQGWKPLCEFLGVEVPDVPFPRLNVKSSAIPDHINRSAMGRRVYRELILMLTMFTAIVAFFIFLIIK